MRRIAIVMACVAVAAPARAQDVPLPAGFTRVQIRPAPLFQAIGLACGRDRAYVRDWQGEVMEWNGTAWTALPPPASEPRGQAIWVAADGAVVIEANESLARWDGRAWSTIAVDPWFRGRHGGLDIGALGGATVPWVLGRGAIGVAIDGTVRPFEVAQTWSELIDFVVLGTDDLLVAHAGGLMHWDGVAWSQDHPHIEGEVFDLLASGPDDVWALGADGAAHFDGDRWVRASDGLDASMLPPRRHGHSARLGGASPDHVYVSTTDRVLHWTGARWETVLDATHRSGFGRGYGRICATSRHVLIEEGGHVLVRAR
ncbi:hypothetical protein [Sandaracinus amylolyticus]|uniref:Uncharacterized protein n=1 Tax=Sandaracinus amylolyticus TaxID=927083 RepID=A0A0F6VYX2_9BACT|nr:hypothetical protein [Sandaracinus amylolyticus]AKF02983.1 hypothetical protein DB32_000131 [Sandaracinus amylolyticus]